MAPATIAAIENGYGQRELDKWKADPSYTPTPYKTHPDTLREIAHAIASGRPLEEREAVYAELVGAAGWLPKLVSQQSSASEAMEAEKAERLAEMQSRYLALSQALSDCERIIREASA